MGCNNLTMDAVREWQVQRSVGPMAAVNLNRQRKRAGSNAK
jgi:hypothetical protein